MARPPDRPRAHGSMHAVNPSSQSSGQPEDAEPRRPVTQEELLRPVDRRRGLQRLPALVVDAVGLAWHASRGNLLAFAACEVLSAVTLAAQLLLVRSLLEDVLGASDPSAGPLIPYLVGIV